VLNNTVLQNIKWFRSVSNPLKSVLFDSDQHITGVNWRTLTSLAPSTHWELSISILNVKMAPEMSGFFKGLPLPFSVTNKGLDLKTANFHWKYAYSLNFSLLFFMNEFIKISKNQHSQIFFTPVSLTYYKNMRMIPLRMSVSLIFLANFW